MVGRREYLVLPLYTNSSLKMPQRSHECVFPQMSPVNLKREGRIDGEERIRSFMRGSSTSIWLPILPINGPYFHTLWKERFVKMYSAVLECILHKSRAVTKGGKHVSRAAKRELQKKWLGNGHLSWSCKETSPGQDCLLPSFKSWWKKTKKRQVRNIMKELVPFGFKNATLLRCSAQEMYNEQGEQVICHKGAGQRELAELVPLLSGRAEVPVSIPDICSLKKD